MARKYEIGLKYFPHDTNMAWDEKVRKLTRRFGAVGYAVFTRLLECIFKDNYYVLFDTGLTFQIIDSLNMSPDDEQLVIKIINEAVRVGLFDSDIFNESKVITSHGIQSRYFEAKKASLKRASRKNDNFDRPYLLVEQESDSLPEITFFETPKLRIIPDEKPKPKAKPKPKVEKVEENTNPEEQEFEKYMKEHYPYIAKMDKPLLLVEYHELCGKYSKPVVDTCIASLNNYKNIKNYRSAKATLNNWCKNEQSRSRPNTANTTASNTASLVGELRTINSARTDEGDDVPE